MERKLKLWLARWLRCKHTHFEYEEAGGRGCPYKQWECECGCSVPVYDVICLDCNKSWTLGDDELIGFFAYKKKEVKP